MPSTGSWDRWGARLSPKVCWSARTAVGQVDPEREVVCVSRTVLVVERREDELHHVGNTRSAATPLKVAVFIVVAHELPRQTRIIRTNESTTRGVRSEAQESEWIALSAPEVGIIRLARVVVCPTLTGNLNLDGSMRLSWRVRDMDGSQLRARSRRLYDRLKAYCAA